MKKFWPANSPGVKFVLLVFVAWLAVINFLGLISSFVPILHRERFSYVEEKFVNPPFFWNRANFDGIHYLDIARKGYGIYQQAFFPLYPQLIRFLTPFFGGRDLMSGIFISWVSSFFSFYLFYKLVELDYGSLVARKSLLFLVAFPTSFFLSLVYSESLFLALLLASFYAARKKRWWLAGLGGAVASYTRLVGIFLFPALLYELWNEDKNAKYPARIFTKFNGAGKILNLLSLLLIPLGLLSYMRFLWEKYDDPLMFLHVQPFFGAERSGGKLILLYQVFWRYFKMILTTKLDPLYFTVWLELLVATGFLLILFLAYKKGIRISYLVFAIFSFFMPTLSGTFSSLPRYVLVLFPCFIYLGLIRRQRIYRILFVIFGLFFVFSILLFFRGYWIS